MVDVHTEKTRSYNMSMIKGKDTKPEIIVRKLLFSKGLRFRIHASNLPGKPDIVLPKFKVIIFVNGCFWHGHENCTYFVVPKTRTDWWLDKINKTKARDDLAYQELSNLGWKVYRIWTCEINKEDSERLNRIVDEIKESKQQGTSSNY